MNLNMMPLTATMGSMTGSPAQGTCNSRTATPTGGASLKGTMIAEIPSITVTTSPNPNTAQGYMGPRNTLKSTSNDENSQHQNSPQRQTATQNHNVTNVSGDDKSSLGQDRSNCF